MLECVTLAALVRVFKVVQAAQPSDRIHAAHAQVVQAIAQRHAPNIAQKAVLVAAQVVALNGVQAAVV